MKISDWPQFFLLLDFSFAILSTSLRSIDIHEDVYFTWFSLTPLLPLRPAQNDTGRHSYVGSGVQVKPATFSSTWLPSTESFLLSDALGAGEAMMPVALTMRTSKETWLNFIFGTSRMVVYLGYSIVSFEPGKHSTDSFHFRKRTQSLPSFVFHGKILAYLKGGGVSCGFHLKVFFHIVESNRWNRPVHRYCHPGQGAYTPAIALRTHCAGFWLFSSLLLPSPSPGLPIACHIPRHSTNVFTYA